MVWVGFWCGGFRPSEKTRDARGGCPIPVPAPRARASPPLRHPSHRARINVLSRRLLSTHTRPRHPHPTHTFAVQLVALRLEPPQRRPPVPHRLLRLLDLAPVVGLQAVAHGAGGGGGRGFGHCVGWRGRWAGVCTDAALRTRCGERGNAGESGENRSQQGKQVCESEGGLPPTRCSSFRVSDDSKTQLLCSLFLPRVTPAPPAPGAGPPHRLGRAPLLSTPLDPGRGLADTPAPRALSPHTTTTMRRGRKRAPPPPATHPAKAAALRDTDAVSVRVRPRCRRVTCRQHRGRPPRVLARSSRLPTAPPALPPRVSPAHSPPCARNAVVVVPQLTGGVPMRAGGRSRHSGRPPLSKRAPRSPLVSAPPLLTPPFPPTHHSSPPARPAATAPTRRPCPALPPPRRPPPPRLPRAA